VRGGLDRVGRVDVLEEKDWRSEEHALGGVLGCVFFVCKSRDFSQGRVWTRRWWNLCIKHFGRALCKIGSLLLRRVFLHSAKYLI
jgi:hypothetical protein